MANNNGITNRIICGNKTDFQEYKKGLGEFYFENSDKYADSLFQIDIQTDEKETFSSIKQRSIRVALNLKKIGVTSKDIIVTCAYHTMDSSVPHISSLFIGAKTGGLHPSQSVRDWEHCLKLVQPSVVFLEEECVENMEKSIKNLEIKPKLIVFGNSNKYITFNDLQKPCDNEDTFVPAKIKDPSETAVILFSSGTTGPQKGMCMSHYSLINKAIATMGPKPMQTEIIVSYSTLFWISSVLQIVFCFYAGFVKLIPSPIFKPMEMLEMIDKYKVTTIYINPVLLRSLLTIKETNKYDTSSLKALIGVGTALSPKENQKLQEIFKTAFITQVYGTSETLTSGTNFNLFRDKEHLQKLNSVGKCSDNCEIKVVDPQTKELLGPNEKGEIYIKSLFKMNGYHNDSSKSYIDEDGFIKTGDLGYYDEEECFYLVGRAKEVFKYRTYHIPVDYLESILMEHPDVLEAAVFGIPHPEDNYHPAACVVLKAGVKANLNDIERYYVSNVAEWYKLRGGIKIVKSIPKTPTSKIQRNKLLDWFALN